MPRTRIEPATSKLSERETLEGFLDFHRQTLLMKCDDLTPEQLITRAVPTSNLSLLGLVRHMVEVERYWFAHILDGAPYSGIYWTEASPDGDFDEVHQADQAEDFARFDAALAGSREAAGKVSDLESLSVTERRGERHSLRWIYVHMIEEYARHNGHADLIREAIDGVTGE